MRHFNSFVSLAVVMTAIASQASAAECGDNYPLAAVPKIVIDDTAPMVSHTVQFKVGIPASEFNQRLINAPLSRLLPGTAKIPAVSGTHLLTTQPFGTAGGTRVVCLADGSTATEEATLNQPGQPFRYKVWNYSIAVAKPIEYALGEFVATPINAQSANITWTYSFKLRTNTFPGYLGGLGRWLFKTRFVEGDYAEMMNVSASTMASYFQPDKP